MMKILHPSQHHSLNVRAAYLHILGDVLGSVGVIISGIILWTTHWNLIDPIITIVIYFDDLAKLRESDQTDHRNFDGVDP